jgi:hypothetical protein
MDKKEPKVTRGIVAMLDALGVRNASVEESKSFIKNLQQLVDLAKVANMAIIQSNPHLQDLWKDKRFTTWNLCETRY